jgi:hypothetical protein
MLEFACAASQQNAAPLATVKASPVVQVTPPVVPLAVASAPNDLFLVGRINNLNQTLDTFGAWSNMPLPWQDLLKGETPDLFPFIQLDSPLDVVMALDPDSSGMPKVLALVSVPLKQHKQVVDALRSSGRSLDHASADLDYFMLMDSVQCAVARANGVSPARLVCGEDRRSIEQLGPFVTTNLATQQFTSRSVAFQFKAEALRSRFGKRANLIKAAVPVALRELSLGSPRFDTALADTLYGLADEAILWIDEIDSASISLNLDATTGQMVAETDLRFRKQKSYLSSALARAAAEVGPAPESFWQLPAESSSAGFAVKRQRDASDEKVVAGISELILGAIEHFGLGGTSLTQWQDAFRAATKQGSASVNSMGPASEVRGKSPEETLAMRALGYYVLGVEEDTGAYSALLDATVQVFNDKKLRAQLARQASWVNDLAPIRTRVVANKAGEPSSIRLYETVVKVPANAANKIPKAFTVNPVIASASARGKTWFVVALNDTLAVSKLKQLVNADPKDSLGQRTDLAVLHQVKPMLASFSSLSGFLGLFGFALETAAKGAVADIERAMPHKGKTPFFVDMLPSAEGPSLQYRFTVPKDVIEDATAAGISLVAAFGKGLGEPKAAAE